MKLQSPAIAAALVLGLSGCSAPPQPKPATQALDPAAESPSNTRMRTKPSAGENKTPLPAGTVLRVRLYHAIDTRQARQGDSFIASLSAPVVIADKTVLPKGTVMRGSIQHATKSSQSKDQTVVTLTLDRMEWNGAEVLIDTNNVRWKTGDHRKRDLAWIGGGSAPRASIGGRLGGGKGAAPGAGAGSEASLAGGAASTGLDQVRIPAESILTFRLEEPVAI